MASFSEEHAQAMARSLEFLRAEYGTQSSEEDDARWIRMGRSEGVEASTLGKSGNADDKDGEDGKFVTVRGRMVMEGVDPQLMLDLLRDCVGRKAWDEAVERGIFVHQFGEVASELLPPCSSDIVHLIYKGIATVQSRDLCLVRTWGKDEDGKLWLVAESCEDDSVPVVKERTRAQLRECGYMVTPTTLGCEVVYIGQLNFNGWMPVAVQNQLMKQQPQTLAKICALLGGKAPEADLESDDGCGDQNDFW